MFYKLKVLNLERDLPILKAPSGIYIAGFNPVGDMELIVKAGEYLANKVKNNLDFEIILTTELKGVPIAQEVARRLNCDYVCLRKEKKCYMLNPKHIAGNSITSGISDYYISELDLNKLKNKKVIFVDDVFSTGSTFLSILNFAKNENFQIVSVLAILKESGDQNLNFIFEGMPIICAGYLPLPKIDKEGENDK